MSTAAAARSEVERAARAERAAVLATVARDTRDLALAEDAVQDALLSALTDWPRRGIPARPGAWLTTVARRSALRALRARRHEADPAVLEQLAAEAGRDPLDAPPLPDAQLELLFACCHPSLDLDAQVALTLRAVGGLTTTEIARAFMVSEPTLAQRLVRAQRKVRDSGVPFAVPPPERLAERLAGVLGVAYLVYAEGHAATRGPEAVRADLCAEAVRIARVVATLLPDEPEALGLAALLLAHDARRGARTGDDGLVVPLEHQDRGRYDASLAAEAAGLLDRALTAERPGPYQVQAAIACLHARAPRAEDTDWPQIAALYGALLRMTPSPMVELARATAVGMASGPAAGLALIDALRAGPAGMEGHHLLHASRGDLLARAGRPAEAEAAYRRALDLAPARSVDRDLLAVHLREAVAAPGRP